MTNHKINIKGFIERWKGRGDEKQETQKFWIELLHDVFGLDNPTSALEFEKKVKLEGSIRFIDVYIPDTRVIIEQKSVDIDLGKEGSQSGGDNLTPYNQARRYDNNLPVSEKARWIVCCNFERFEIHDMQKPLDAPEVVLLENLEKEYYRLQFLIEQGNEHLKKEMEVSLQAGEIIGQIYDEFLKQYIHPDDPQTLKSLNVLCVRLVFCLYAEDAGLFGEKRCMFHDYLSQFKPGRGEMRKGLIELFEVLNTPVEERDPYLDDSLKAFPYCNGGLFADRNIEIPRFNDTLAELVLKHASDDFDWSQISPTIFGAVFESTLNPETRRSGGMHYTSIENIHKVIDPLFLDDLKEELAAIKAEPIEKKRIQKAREYQDKLASLKFLDPACGSGNFLTETYLSLRRLENEAMFLIGDMFNPIKVNIHQFYGIEINDFAVATATTALWIAEAQMMAETEKMLNISLDFLPLKSYHNIVEGNALRMDWNYFPLVKDEPITIVADTTHLLREPTIHYGEIYLRTKEMDFDKPRPEYSYIEFDYILGNPPFVGARMMSDAQKQDILNVFGKGWKNVGNLDYVCCWYKKAADLIVGTKTRCAFVSTNSVTQGEQVANLWKPLMDAPYNVHIDFAWRTFRWDSEASIKAHVHCVVVGFSIAASEKKKQLFEEGRTPYVATNINGYLIDSPNIAIEKSSHPICGVPEVGIGNKPIDGGFYLFSKEEMVDFISSEPDSSKFFRPWYGAQEFINNRPRYCLWLGDCSPAELRRMPKCMERVESVRNYRLASPSAGTVKLADKPTRFHVENMPKGSYIVIPQVSSQRRRYIPMGYMDDSILCSDKVRIMPNGTLYHFGILESNVHMSWMRAICCRLKSDYSYTINDVYNNFPWPSPTDAQKAKIEQTALAILDARAKYPDCSLADLYDELTMPVELRRAHQENDKAVMEAYGFRKDMSESDIVAELFKMYKELTERKSEMKE